MKQAYVKGTGIRIIGTFETIPGCAHVEGFDENQRPLYAGGTEVWWDNQVTETDPADNQPIYVDENRDTHPSWEVEFRDA